METFGQLARKRIDELRGGMSLEDAASGGQTTKRTLEKWATGESKNVSEQIVIRCFIHLGLTDDEAKQEAEELKAKAEALSKAQSDNSTVVPFNKNKPTHDQPYLSGPPDAHLISHYAAATLDVVGRVDEEAKLENFLDDQAPFRWMQIAGEGGQGKSRLGLELIKKVEKLGWEAGLLEEDSLNKFGENWDNWQPNKPHLLVIDYLVGREKVVGPMFRALLARADVLRLPVRLLFLERQRWDRGNKSESNDKNSSANTDKQTFSDAGRADWFVALSHRPDGNTPAVHTHKFDDGVIELTQLDDPALVSIVRDIAELDGQTLSLQDDDISKRLKHIDTSGRPLYAYFLGEVLQTRQLTEGWGREELLTAVLEKDCGKRWITVEGNETFSLGAGSEAERLAVLATMVEGLDCDQYDPIDGLDTSQKNRRCALAITHVPIIKGKVPKYIPAQQPDILGEWLVISSLDEDLRADEMAKLAWNIDPFGMVRFLIRLAQDFPKQNITHELAQFVPDGEISKALYSAASRFLVSLFRQAETDIPSQLITALHGAAESGDAQALFSLALCYQNGVGVDVDASKAVVLYQQAADAGDAQAMFNLALCYQKGDGVDVDASKAVLLCQQAADAGNAQAMCNLALCYQNGVGVDVDASKAVVLYQQAADAGNAKAMFNLALCYEKGVGVDVDASKAAVLYQQAADAGDAQAMCNLALCYDNGDGVDVDASKAVELYQKAADAGNAQAMCNLALCYGKGEGVEQDFDRVVSLLEQAVEHGHDDAAELLAKINENRKNDGSDK